MTRKAGRLRVAPRRLPAPEGGKWYAMRWLLIFAIVALVVLAPIISYRAFKLGRSLRRDTDRHG
jgi:hypothetical protein